MPNGYERRKEERSEFIDTLLVNTDWNATQADAMTTERVNIYRQDVFQVSDTVLRAMLVIEIEEHAKAHDVVPSYGMDIYNVVEVVEALVEGDSVFDDADEHAFYQGLLDKYRKQLESVSESVPPTTLWRSRSISLYDQDRDRLLALIARNEQVLAS